MLGASGEHREDDASMLFTQLMRFAVNEDLFHARSDVRWICNGDIVD
jgi:hypothetical protein